MTSLPRTLTIDWLRIQVESFECDFYRTLLRLIALPFIDTSLPVDDVTDVVDNLVDAVDDANAISAKPLDILVLNKIWHRVWEFQGSRIGAYVSPTPYTPSRFFVDLNGGVLAFLDITLVVDLILTCSQQYSFFCNRFDIALDFPLADGCRLSLRPWELFLDQKLIYQFRTVKRVCSSGGFRDGSTVYLGSRESECFVRFYDRQNDDGTDCDRWETEFKRFKSTWVAQNLILSDRPVEFLHQCAVESVQLRHSSATAFFKNYKFASGISVSGAKPRLDIERSVRFIERHGPTLAMLCEFFGPEKFNEFLAATLDSGKLKMKSRHRNTIAAAKFFAAFVLLVGFGLPAFADSPLVCPVSSAPATLQSQMVEKFPIDIVLPSASEQAFFNQVGDGCFMINSGMNFDRICLPGMIVNALRPFVIMGAALRFIFS